MRLPASVVLSLVLAVSVVAQDSRPASAPATLPRTVVILHTNDLHGTIRAVEDTRSKAGLPKLVGGVQELCAAIDDERARHPHTLLLDAGDWYQGTPEGTLSKGRCSVELMNAVGFDGAVLGNHDFDDGPINLDHLLGVAKFAVFGANLGVLPGQPKPPYLERVAPGKLFTVGPLKVFVDGLLTEESNRINSPASMGGAKVFSEVDGATLAVDRAKKAGADAVVLVNHIGKDRHLVIGREVRGIDVLIGGHNHRDVMDEGLVIPSTGTLIAQAAANAQALGIVTLTLDEASPKIVARKARLRRIAGDPEVAVPRLKPIIDFHETSVAERMNQRLAEAPTAIARDYDLRRPNPIGNLLTEQMLATSEADVAVHNLGGIRADIPAGTVTVRSLFMVSPFGNSLVTVKLAGKHLRTLLEKHLANPSRGFAIRGLTVRWAERGGRKVIDAVLFDGTPLDDDRELTIVTTDYIAGAADGASPFLHARARRDLGVTLLDMSIARTQEAGTLRADADNPWVEVVEGGSK